MKGQGLSCPQVRQRRQNCADRPEGSAPWRPPFLWVLCLAPLPALGQPLMQALAARLHGASHKFIEGDWLLQGTSAQAQEASHEK